MNYLLESIGITFQLCLLKFESIFFLLGNLDGQTSGLIVINLVMVGLYDMVQGWNVIDQSLM